MRLLIMKKLFLPQIGEIAYLMQKAVIIREILETFQIVRVCFLNDDTDFYVDIISLKKQPDYRFSSLSINLFTGGQRI